MAKYRDRLPQLDGDLFLTDGGIETTLIFHEGLSLPYFAAFHLLRSEAGRYALGNYYRRHAAIARDVGAGFILESATWRASADWGARLNYSARELAHANARAIDLLHELRRELESTRAPIVISGCVGPRGDGYRPEALMSPIEAQAYHSPQVRVFAERGVDLVTAITMTNTSEAIGVARAAAAEGVPAVVSFTVETNGRLPTGETLEAAMETVDAAADPAPAYYMVNCAHPTHFMDALKAGSGSIGRIRGVRANASKCSHSELDEATELDAGNPVELAEQYAELRSCFPHINVLGGCCGTDHRHIEMIAERCTARVVVAS